MREQENRLHETKLKSKEIEIENCMKWKKKKKCIISLSISSVHLWQLHLSCHALPLTRGSDAINDE